MGATIVHVQAHFDGDKIVLDETIDLEPGTRLLITVIPNEQAAQFDNEREDWFRVAREGLARAYGEDEPNYPPESIREPNPEWKYRT